MSKRKKKIPTIRDVAKLADVSTASVSRVLNGVDVHSNDMKERVSAAKERLKFMFNKNAQELARRRSTNA